MSDAPDEIWIKSNRGYVSVWARPIFTDPFDPRGVEYTRTDAIPSQDALIRAALEVASRRIYVLVSNEGRGFYRRGRGGYSNGIDACHDAIREMMDDPGELARIKAKAGDRT